MKKLLLVSLLIFGASSAVATSLSIKKSKDAPTPYELIINGKILERLTLKEAHVAYYIAWGKTKDIYSCLMVLGKSIKCQRLLAESSNFIDHFELE